MSATRGELKSQQCGGETKEKQKQMREDVAENNSGGCVL